VIVPLALETSVVVVVVDVDVVDVDVVVLLDVVVVDLLVVVVAGWVVVVVGIGSTVIVPPGPLALSIVYGTSTLSGPGSSNLWLNDAPGAMPSPVVTSSPWMNSLCAAASCSPT